jgi:GWxTD domain-containing protein
MNRTVFAAIALLCTLHVSSAATKKPKLAEQFQRWLDRDVVYIITDEERKEFLALNTDADRDKYMESFWDARNPKHGSEHNSLKEEHYARLEYANSHFGRESNTPGWMTDMGRAWILFGAPTSRHPFTGYSQIYPMELWFYENKTGSPSLPSFFYLLFYSDGGTSEYKFYRPFLDGPLKLVRGSQFNSNRDVYKFFQPMGGDVAHSVLSLIASEPVDTQTYRPDMSSDMLIARIENFANDPFNVKKLREMRALHAKVNSYFMVDQSRPLALSSLVLTDPTGKSWLDYGVLIDDARLGRRDGSQLKIAIGYRLTTAAGETILEDAEERTWAAFSDASPGATGEAKFAPFVLASRLPIEPGTYKLMIEITNREAQQTYNGETDVMAGGSTGQPSFSGPLVTTSVDRVARPNSLQPFQYFGVQFHPSARHEISHPDPLRLLFELHEPAGSTSDYQMEYIVASVQGKDSRRSTTEAVPHAEFKDGRLLKSKTIAINDLENGDYRLIVNLRVAGSREVVESSNTPLRIAAEKNEFPLYFLADTQASARPGVAAYMRALEAASQKNDAAATEYFRQALDQNPANTFAGQSLVQLYFTRRMYSPIADLYKRLGITAFKGSPVTLAQIALSFRQNGDAEQARNVISAALGLFPGNTTLSSLQSKSR